MRFLENKCTQSYFPSSAPVFESVLEYYIHGTLHAPDHAGGCKPKITKELEFWQLTTQLAQLCCRHKMPSAVAETTPLDDQDENVLFAGVTVAKEQRMKLYRLFEVATSSKYAKLMATFSVFVILLSWLIMVLQSMDEICPKHTLLAVDGEQHHFMFVRQAESNLHATDSSGDDQQHPKNTSGAHSNASNGKAEAAASVNSEQPAAPTHHQSSSPPPPKERNEHTLNETIRLLEHDEDCPEAPWIGKLEAAVVYWFTFELILRFMVSPNKLQFVREVMNIIDFLAIAPYYIELILYWAKVKGGSFDLVGQCLEIGSITGRIGG
jgi:hypothetical protein